MRVHYYAKDLGINSFAFTLIIVHPKAKVMHSEIKNNTPEIWLLVF